MPEKSKFDESFDSVYDISGDFDANHNAMPMIEEERTEGSQSSEDKSDDAFESTTSRTADDSDRDKSTPKRGICNDGSLVLDLNRTGSHWLVKNKGTMNDEIEMDNFELESRIALNDVHSSKKEDSLILSYGGPQTGSRTSKNLFSEGCSYRRTKSSVSLTAKSRATRWRSGSMPNQVFRISKESTEMKWERIEAFFYNQGMEIALSVLYLSVNLLVGGHGAYQFTAAGGWTTDNAILRVTLPIARAGGRLVTLNCALLLLTACKYLWTLVRTYITPVVPIGFPIDHIMPKYHRVVALTIIFSGCIVHTLPQIVNYASRSITIEQEGMRIWTFGDGFATKQLLLTGTALAIIFSIFYLTTLQSFRKTAAGFRWFWTFHMCGIATAYPLLLIHGTCRGHPIFLYFALLPLILYLIDIFMRRRNIFHANIRRWIVHNDDGQQVTEVVLDCPKGFSYTPGQYAELKLPAISAKEWHPFTIASAPNEDPDNDYDEIVFFIKNSGRWTGALAEYATAYDLSKAPKKMFIRGPHGAPAMNYEEYKHIIVIGSGVGVTPLLSIWDHLVDKGKKLIPNRKSRQSSKVSTAECMNQSMQIMEESMNLLKNMNQSSHMANMSQSINIFNSEEFSGEIKKLSRENTDERSQSIDLFDFSKSIAFLNFSKSIDLFDSFSPSLARPSFNKSGSTTYPQEKYNGLWKKIRWKCISLLRFLESLVVSLPLFIIFVLGETIVVLLHFAEWHLATNIIGSSLSLIAFIAHGSVVVVWTIAVGFLYMRLFRCWLELAIIIVNCFALWFSIKGCKLAIEQENTNQTTDEYILFFGCVIALQAIRIFHTFYRTLKVKPEKHSKPPSKAPKRQRLVINEKVEFRSVDGIVINRKYSNMKFASRVILPPILRHGLSDVFSMEFYGTREKPKEEKVTEHSLVEEMMGSVGENIDIQNCNFYTSKKNQSDFFCPGRPDWNLIFLKAISQAHVSNEEGESVGVFFCGAPAIAKSLQIEAQRVTAQHQYVMKQFLGKRCKCKVIVHSENF